MSLDLFMQKPLLLSVYTNQKLQVPDFHSLTVLYGKIPGPTSSIYTFQLNLASFVGLACSKESVSALLLEAEISEDLYKWKSLHCENTFNQLCPELLVSLLMCLLIFTGRCRPQRAGQVDKIIWLSSWCSHFGR